ncbi:unnamed protein product, partial [Ixodes hexagonus]
MAPPTPTPTKAQSFLFSAPSECPIDLIIDALYAIVGVNGLSHLQHHGANKYLAAVSSPAAAERLVAQGNLLLSNVVVPLEQVGPRTVYVSVFRLPPYVPDEALQTALGAYGKILSVNHPTYKDRPTLFTGTRVVRMEMAKPVPNFVTVAGHRVMMEYRGMKRVCARCGLEGHFGATCRTPRCSRCGVFGHSTEGCVAPCKRCGHNHATTDCTQRRSYSAVIRDEGPPDPGPSPPVTVPGPLDGASRIAESAEDHA